MEPRETARAIADRLASPDEVRGSLSPDQGWWPQSLAHGAAGVALLHIERARTGDGPWQRAHDWLACASEGGVDGGPDIHLHYGAPALAFALHAARPGHYDRASATLDTHIVRMVRQRLQDAHARIDRGAFPELAEFDAIRGLTGLGALLLRRGTQDDLLRAVLDYLVRLTQPVRHEDGATLPGWWSPLAPSGKLSPEGHGNNGVAHGIGGPLALLALTARRGIAVAGQLDAVRTILRWLDRWRQNGDSGAWWPYWITREHLRAGTPGPGPDRPSWCYGTAGLARAQQLAALVVGDDDRQRAAETALLHAMTDPGRLDTSLCHGFAGLLHTTRLAAADALTPGLADCLPGLLARLADARPADGTGMGLLEGAAGTALALHGFAVGGPSRSGWDACFLIDSPATEPG